MIKRIFIEKKNEFQTAKNILKQTILSDIGVELHGLRSFVIYEIFNVSEDAFESIKWQVLAEKATDEIFESINLSYFQYLSYTYLPGQYDQRADSAMQCIGLLGYSEVIIQCAELLVFQP
ncbi:MAG: hypothetical protein Q7I99_09385, partial [Acholeplasmataceae bacterium]|nr:hypothetical protein [Acholeplasmataceae bacterium]